MSEIKYTNDGKKVAVIGKLNAQETIVQEIFVTKDNAELPSGENFVVKSLHDVPVESWHQREVKNWEKRYNEAAATYREEIRRLESSTEERKILLREKLEYAGKVLKNIAPEHFELLCDYLTGNINFVVPSVYTPKIIPMAEFHQTYERKLRLVSIYGDDEGNLEYGMGRYNDSSGYNAEYFQPFKTFEDAFTYFSFRILEADVSDDIIKAAAEYNIVLDEKEVAEFKESKRRGLQNNIDSYQADIDKWKALMENA